MDEHGTWTTRKWIFGHELRWFSGCVLLQVDRFDDGSAYATLEIRDHTVFNWELPSGASDDDLKREAVACARRELNLCLANLASASPPLPRPGEPDPFQENLW